MLDLQGFQNIKKLYEGQEQVVYSALREDGLSVILKALRSERPRTEMIALMYHEYDIAKNLNLPGVIQTYDLIDQQNRYVLVQENIGGISLQEYLKQNPIKDLLSFFKLAIPMASIINDLHRKSIIHKDIKPGNFIINPESLILKLTDFNFSSHLLHEEQEIVAPEKLEGTLLYIAPEQTGRMNMNIDYRADFYSLGITFYEMLTGEVPFSYTDPLELIHAHLATPLPKLSNTYFEIPCMLKKIVEKMAAKNPIDRYQSAIGLKADLERCQSEFINTGKINDFPLGEKEVFDRLNLSQKLYGREAEAKKLLSAYDHVCQGSVEVFMVSGYSGIGKTKLISEVHKPMVKQKGYFISGKFDQLQRNTPYTAITQALNQLARQILAEPEDRFEKIKKSIIDTLGGVAQVMIDLAPDIEHIIGPQPPLEKLPSQETQNRMMLFFLRFLRVIAQADHPLVLFIDDLQWIDGPSLKLLEYIMTDSELGYVLLIGAYRDNEVDENHMLKNLFREMKSKRKDISTLILSPLTSKNFQDLLKDSFHRDGELIAPLADLLLKRTEGNPFFCKQVINAIYQEKLLYFNYEKGEWSWDLDAIANLKITKNVVDLMLKKLSELPQETRTMLNYAACVGNQFTIEILMVISGQPPETIGKALLPALEKDLIFTHRSGYKLVSGLSQQSLADVLSKDIVYQFIHDRVQQTVYQGISEDEKKRTHLNIARLLLKKYPEECQKERLFEVTDHFNEAQNLLDPTEKIDVMRLNYQAAIQAKNAVAYQSMFNYLMAALNLMDENIWNTNYEFAFQLNREYALSLFLINKSQEAENLIRSLLIRAKTNLEKAQLYHIQSINQLYHGDIERGIETSISALELLDVTLKMNPGPIDMISKLLGLRWKMRHFNVATLDQELKMLDNPSIETAFNILAELSFFLFEKGGPVMGYEILTAVELMVTNGKPPSAGLLIAEYAFLILVSSQNINRALQYWSLAEKLSQEFPDKYNSGNTYTIGGLLINHVRYPLKFSEAYIQRSIQDYRESGNINMEASIGLSTYALFMLSEGKSLEKVIQGYQIAFNAAHKQGIKRFSDAYEMIFLSCKNLMAEDTLQNERFKFLEKSLGQSDSLLLQSKGWKHLSFYYFFMEEFEEALRYHFLWYAEEIQIRFELFSYEAKTVNALTLAKIIPSTKGMQKWRYQRRFKRILSELKWISSSSPENYLHHFLFLEGTQEKLKGNFGAALIAFNKAIENAKQGDFYLWTALGNELIADMLSEQGQPRSMVDYVREAYYYYGRYGMNGKLKSLKKRYPHCFSEFQEIESSERKSLTESVSSKDLDYISVIKASQTISGEIILEKFLNKMLHITLENAGAQKAIFLENNKNIWTVVAKLCGEQDQEKFEILNTPLKTFEDLPKNLIQFSLRSKEPVVLYNATEDHQYSQDPYVLKTHPKSILILPLLYQNREVGILYLENNLTAGAFTQDRVTLLTTLTSQIVISLENARHFEVMQNLYHSTERFVPKAFLSMLKKETIEEIKVGDSAKVDLAPMFADIRNFTGISEAIGTEKTAFLLNAYMQKMTPIIRRRQGFVSQFLGDGIMALFPRNHVDAVDAAIEMRAALIGFNEMIQAQGFDAIEIGIGLNAGPAMLITLGEEERIDASVVSDVVNSAARIEGLNKLYGTGVLMSDAVYSSIPNPENYLIRLVDKVKVKGKKQAMGLYEAMALYKDESRADLQNYILEFEEAYELYVSGDFSAAQKAFETCLSKRPEDSVAKVFKERCEAFLTSGAPSNWDGTYTALEK